MYSYMESNTLDIFSAIVADDLPCYILSGSGPAWFYAPDLSQIVKVERGIELVPIELEENSSGNILVSSHTYIILVPKKEIVEIGYN